MRLLLCLFAVVSLTPVFSAEAAPKALAALEVAQKMLPEKHRGELVQIYGPRSDKDITPTTWRFIFFDDSAEQDGRLVVVKKGRVVEMRDGYVEMDRARLAAYKRSEAIQVSKIKVDSDQALDKIQKNGALGNAKLSTVIYRLEKDQDLGRPLWTLQFRADKGGKETDIGSAQVDAESGEVVQVKIDVRKLAPKKQVPNSEPEKKS